MTMPLPNTHAAPVVQKLTAVNEQAWLTLGKYLVFIIVLLSVVMVWWAGRWGESGVEAVRGAGEPKQVRVCVYVLLCGIFFFFFWCISVSGSAGGSALGGRKDGFYLIVCENGMEKVRQQEQRRRGCMCNPTARL